MVPQIGLIDDDVLDEVPRRGRESTKFAAGAVLVCGGSLGLTGAPSLASESAQRAGAGYVTALIPGSLNIVFEQRLLEAMSVPLPDDDGALTVRGAWTRSCGAARAPGRSCSGPGWDATIARRRWPGRPPPGVEIPLLLDADALFAHAGRLATSRAAPGADGADPARGRARPAAGARAPRSRRTGSPPCAQAAAARRRRRRCSRATTRSSPIPDGPAAVSRGGAAALATAGTGDVLSGVIGAYLAKGMDPFAAACAGVFVHAGAGRLAAAEIGEEGVIASDVIGLLPRARAPRPTGAEPRWR